MNTLAPVFELSLFDLLLFSELARTQSVRELARRRGLSPSQVSRSLKKTEEKVGLRLFERLTEGVRLTPDGQALLKRIDRLIPQFEGALKGNRTSESNTVTVGGASFLVTHVAVPAICGLMRDKSQERLSSPFRLLEIAPDLQIWAGLRKAFDLCLHFGRLDWPQTWTSELVGQVEWQLCARRGHPLLRGRLSESKILSYGFVVPTYWTPEGLNPGDDGCPVSVTKRKVAFETSTAEAAIQLVSRSEALGFLPTVLVNPWMDQNKVEPVSYRPWQGVKKPLYLSVRSDAVTERLFSAFLSAVRQVVTD